VAEGICGMHQIGITLSGINDGIAFFKAVFGAVEVFRTGPFDVEEAFMRRWPGTPALPASVIWSSCAVVRAPMLSCSNGLAKTVLPGRGAIPGSAACLCV